MPAILPNLWNTLGLGFVGCVITSCLYGSTCLQTVQYYRSYWKDSYRLKGLVLVLFILNTFHQVTIAYLIYFFVISNFGNVTWFAERTWSIAAQLILSAVITFIVGCFLVIRLWYFSKYMALVAFCGFFVVAQLAVNLILPIKYFSYPSIADASSALPGVGIAGLVTALICDISVSASLCFYLQRGRGGFRGTNDLITKLITMTIMTGLLPTLVMIANSIVYFVVPDTFWTLFFNFPLSKLYINVVLTSLNSRKSLRNTLNGKRSGDRDEMDFSEFVPSDTHNSPITTADSRVFRPAPRRAEVNIMVEIEKSGSPIMGASTADLSESSNVPSSSSGSGRSPV